MSSLESNFGLSATKSYDDDNGLVCISGWKKYADGKTILLTVMDTNSQKTWTRLIDPKASTKSTIRVIISKSSVHHVIQVTAEPLDERKNGSCQGAVRQFAVQSTIQCVAQLIPDSQLDILIDLINYMLIQDNPDAPKRRMSLEVQRMTFDRALLSITRIRKSVRKWLITVTQTDIQHPKFIFLISAETTTTHFDMPVVFKAGCSYTIDVEGLDFTGGVILCQDRISFRADLTLADLEELHQKALGYAGSKSALCRVFYRNRAFEYFDKILTNRGGIMEAYLKDNSGDPGSPINSRLDGLFFMASVKPGSKKGEPIVVSAFGPQRILVPAAELLAKARNLYFADFYCMRSKIHQVTLVMANPGSTADLFCSTHLLSLNMFDRRNNPFLFYNENGKLQVCAKNNFLVELLFTEDLDIRGYKTQVTSIVGKGSSTVGGILKNPECPKCNLRLQQHIGTESGMPTTLPYSF